MVEENLAPDIVHWNHALRASAAGARWREARARLQEMQVRYEEVEFRCYKHTAVCLFELLGCKTGALKGERWNVTLAAAFAVDDAPIWSHLCSLAQLVLTGTVCRAYRARCTAFCSPPVLLPRSLSRIQCCTCRLPMSLPTRLAI